MELNGIVPCQRQKFQLDISKPFACNYKTTDMSRNQHRDVIKYYWCTPWLQNTPVCDSLWLKFQCFDITARVSI